MNAHDGQAFGSLALDPLLSRPQAWTDGRTQVAYRAARPVLGWLVMLTSFGSAGRASWSLAVWTVVGIALMAAAAAALCTQSERSPTALPLLLTLPGVFGLIVFAGLSDGLATGFVLLGLTFWLRDRDTPAAALFVLAALTRESTLLVPLALAAVVPFARRSRKLALPVAAYAGWVAIVWLRLHALPTAARQSHIGVPLIGLVRAVPHWDWVEVACAASVAGLGAVAFVRAPAREIRALVLLSAVFASTMQYEVWRSWDFTRPLLPLTIVGLCLLMPRAHGRRERTQHADSGCRYPFGDDRRHRPARLPADRSDVAGMQLGGG